MKMNQHIAKTACPPGNRRLLRSHCSGAFVGPRQAGGATGGNACSCCCDCNKLFFNRQRIKRKLISLLPAAEQSSKREKNC
jgi:hypothetical protein